MKLSESPTANKTSVKTSVTVLLPRLAGWVGQLRDENRYPNLETVLAKASSGRALSASLDQLRFELFKVSYDKKISLPVASLSQLASGSDTGRDDQYFLRLDPVTLHADMGRLLLLRSGFADLPFEYRQAVQQTIQNVMQDEGLELQLTDGDCWTIALDTDPGVQFTSLDDSLGADVSECLPEQPAGRAWKKLLNEVQMALHALPLNEERRQQGKTIINSVWIWGGGYMPQNSNARTFDLVYTADPVSLGLAKLQGSSVKALRDLPANAKFDHGELDRSDLSSDESERGVAQSILVDWAVVSTGSQAVADQNSSADHSVSQVNPAVLDEFCSGLINKKWQHRGELWLHTPEQSWHLAAQDLLHFWKRRKPLVQQLSKVLKSC